VTDAEAVAAALARLVTGTTPPATPDRPATDRWAEPAPPPEAVVDEAEAALSGLPSAAEFVQADGEPRLSCAISAAEEAGDHAVAERGRTALAELERFRAAAVGRREPPTAHRRRNDEQFHRARTTLLTGGGIQSE
jgi:hypothetical protein